MEDRKMLSRFSIMKKFKLDKEMKDLIKMGRLDEAKEVCDQLINISPRKISNYIVKIRILTAMKSFVEILTVWDKILKIQPNNMNYIYNKASILATKELNEYENAIVLLEEVIKKNNKDVDAILLKGISLACLKKYEEAKECYNQVIKLSPGNAFWAYCNKAICLMKSNELDEALELCNIAIKQSKDGDLDFVYFTKSRVFALKNDKESCLVCLKKSVNINPEFKKEVLDAEEFKEFLETEDLQTIIN